MPRNKSLKEEGGATATACVHGGEMIDYMTGSITAPIFQTSTFYYPYAIDSEGRYTDNKAPYFYTRLMNPTVRVAERKLSILEGTEDAVAFSSGMAAISTAVLETMGSRGHILSVRDLYGGTYSLFTEILPSLGHTATFFSRDEVENLDSLIRENTKAIYVETPTNPTLDIYDIEKIFAIAHEHGLTTIIDNTFPSPVNMRPHKFGADIIIHSATKYLSGHSDIIAGMVAGSNEMAGRIRNMQSVLGGSMDPFAGFLLDRGMKTLELRVRRQNDNAMHLAEFLEDDGRVNRVLYPGLKSHSGYGIARRLMTGFGGMVSFEVRGGVERARRFVKRLRIAKVAASLGGVESLVTIPSVTSHRQLSRAELLERGISPGLVRFSAGIEDVYDIIDDVSSALG
ncbi:MAG: aminotransferase class I/II-fold pyridoxal phosphate-dependent enzyme [Thermoplasmata archaeon YP2-bin.285]|uniref:Aminotransferase class I/II-fold pyridoxal phosphate-dependent enzyme n=1 Tax=Candidatus Sysuiplasma superficiale TaxID=2823368 RepID=A0A8J7YLP3_9ARCH|nr:aminotransferase class I/II-fold pyridoxal phosphate-dependent enzyme [Candidatus Sysuiplasma superficiale]